MPPTRVLIYPMPRLLHDLLHQLLAGFSGVELVECPTSADGLVDAARQTGADLVIVSERDAPPRAVGSLLDQLPSARALAVSHDGRSGVIYELRPVRRAIGELSAATLRAAVRATALPLELGFSEPIMRPAP